MRLRSLRLRLAAAAGASLSVALLLAGFGLAELFERHVVRRVDGELETYVRQIAANVVIADDGVLQVPRALADPRFSEPLSGLYWQIDDDTTGAKLRSRSLWDHVLALPTDPLDIGTVHRHRLLGPAGATLLVAERRVIFPPPSQHRLRIAAAVDEKEVLDARAAFAGDISKSLLFLSAILLIASWTQITIGLKPLEALRRSVAAVRFGSDNRLTVEEPEEVMPLVAEVNALLDEKAKTIESAKARAADLAHGLKTPLAVLMADADRLKQRGETEIGAEIEDVVGGMRRHIERELSRARLHARALHPVSSCSVAEVCTRLVRVLSRGPESARLDWHVDVGGDVIVNIGADDLSELLGAVLENAAKWARTNIYISAQRGDPTQICIDDDGPGVPTSQLPEIGRRGVRLDQMIEGTGLGLAIAGEIAEAYGGRITFEARHPSGLRVIVSLPTQSISLKGRKTS